MARKLASIQLIKDVSPIPGADKIELAHVLGWQVIVEKGFKPGDKVVYCEIDSVLSDDAEHYPEFQFLKSKKFRVKTIRLKGHISQGICFPVSIMQGKRHHNMEEGEDVTETLGIKQWVPKIPACLMGIQKGPFPNFIPKTDETRVQLLQQVLDRHKGTLCYVTEKLDGSSVTYYVKDGVFGVCSRNIELLESEGNAFWKWARENELEKRLRSIGQNVAIQGELFGQGIQGNPLELPERHVRFFNWFWIDEYRYADYEEAVFNFAALGLEVVPYLFHHKLSSDIDELVKLSVDKSILNSKVWREGIVVRPLKETQDFQMSNIGMSNSRLTFKVVNPEYLVEVEE